MAIDDIAKVWGEIPIERRVSNATGSISNLLSCWLLSISEFPSKSTEVN